MAKKLVRRGEENSERDAIAEYVLPAMMMVDATLNKRAFEGLPDEAAERVADAALKLAEAFIKRRDSAPAGSLYPHREPAEETSAESTPIPGPHRNPVQSKEPREDFYARDHGEPEDFSAR